MPRRFTYIVVEGPHDTAFIGKILREGPLQLGPVSLLGELDPFWERLVPRTYPPRNPHTSEEEFKRVRMPEFFQSATVSVAVEWAEGFERVPVVFSDSLLLLSGTPDALAMVVDADSDPVTHVFADIVARTQAARPGTLFPAAAGQVHLGPPRTGVFVLPDNNAIGTLEELLLDCGSVSYPALKAAAEAYVGLVPGPPTLVGTDEMAEFNKPAGRKKAILSSMSSVLKPGKAVPNTIRDNSWVTATTLSRPLLRQLSAFLADLANPGS